MTKALPPKHIVLYADDDPDDLQLVTESFEKYSTNVEVVTLNHGEEVLSYLGQISSLDPSPCLIILDINMPMMNGKEVLVNIRNMEQFNDVPVILFTTSSVHVDSAFAKKYNAGFITKPLNSSQMAKITNEFIEHCSEEIKKNIRRQVN
ncbi:MAG: response regulator [Chitinophagaceae bacterium]|nr:response regulator [Chitinophagaceae bacterium]